MHDDSTLIDETIPLDLSGKTYVITRLDTGQIARGLRDLFTVYEALKDGAATPQEVVADHPEECMHLAALALREPLEFIERLDPLVTMEVVEAIWRCNRNFLVGQVMPRFYHLTLTIQKLSQVH